MSGRTAIRLNVDGNRSYDSGTIVAQLGDGSSYVDQFQRPIQATNLTVGLEHVLTDDQTLRLEYRREQDSRENQGVGNFDLQERAFTRTRNRAPI